MHSFDFKYSDKATKLDLDLKNIFIKFDGKLKTNGKQKYFIGTSILLF